MKSMYADDEEEYDPRLMPGPEGKIPRFYEVGHFSLSIKS